MKFRVYINSKLEGFRVQGLGLKGCREKCENGRERRYSRHFVTNIHTTFLAPLSQFRYGL